MTNKLAELMLVVVITFTLLLITEVESRRTVLNGDSVVTVAASESDIIDLKCTDTTFTEEHYTIWYRRTTGGDETEIYRNGMLLTSDLGQEALAYSLNNSTEFELTISITRGLDVGQWLHGNGYRCEVMETTGGTLFESSHSLINVEYPPPARYPLCAANIYQTIGQTATLSCYSEPGNPYITFSWWNNDSFIANRRVQFQSNIRFALISFNYSFNNQQQDLEENYECRVTWYNDVKTCTVLPTPSHEPSTLIPTTEHKTTYFLTMEGKMTSQGTLTSKDNLLYYIIGGSSIGCAALLILIIWCNVQKKKADRGKSIKDYHEMQTGKWNKQDPHPDKGSYGIDNPMFNGPSPQDQLDPTESMSNASMTEGNEKRSQYENTGLRDSHVMEENTVYAGL